MCHIILQSAACCAALHFGTLSYTWHEFRRGFIEYKMCVPIFSTVLSKIFIFLRWIWRSVIIKVNRFSCKLHNLLIPPGSDVRSVLSDVHVISSRHAGWGGLGWIDLPCPLQFVCQRHTPTLAPHQVSPLRGRHGHNSPVQQADVPRQIPGIIYQWLPTVVEWMENRH